MVVTTLFREQQTYTESVLLHVISTIERALKRPVIMETLDTLEPEVRFWMDKLLSKSTCQAEIVNATAVGMDNNQRYTPRRNHVTASMEFRSRRNSI